MTIEHDGTPLRVARPASEPTTGVVVLHQAAGYAPQTTTWLERLAGRGHLTVAPLLLHRQGVERIDPFERFGGDLGAFAAFLPGDVQIRADIAAALSYLAAETIAPASVGVLGFSFGGRAAYLTAAEHTLGAAVSFYGNGIHREGYPGNDGIPSLPGASALRTPWLGLYGEQDFLLSPGELDEWEQDLATSPVPAELVRYPGAGHAFDVDEVLVPGMPSPYVAAAAEDATARALRFLDTSLR